ncbi:hypothetical protein ACFX5U_16510 [Sphingobacterium sp. SG20118]|uniref:hypothetical protein n=1 Tax=Sphingobacterium TaxID=28453 RepID=UPI0004F6942A|nr:MULTISPECIES: hypothetical protein [Sphingobacterium]AIM38228.1 hypothetical protein KO02_17220 [Sphingobacterium sp. ML3W]MDH5825663.1 hypothetical protein [Sphingobacterium faecium]
MSIVSKDLEIQENLITLIEDLQNNIHDISHRIADYGQLYNQARNRIGAYDDRNEKITDQIGEKHHNLYHKKKALNYLFEIIMDYRDANGIYHEYDDMIAQVENIMLAFAEKEQYEDAATIKKWHDRLHKAIYIV